MKKLCLFAVSLLTLSFVVVTQGSWTLDTAHYRLGFTAVHMGISDANGCFEKVECTVTTTNDKDFSDATFELVADASSINTGHKGRDNHLQSEDFFAISQYPMIQFKSTSCTKLKGKKYALTGNLSMHGITQEVKLTATHNGNTKNRAGTDVAGFKITGKFNRLDFGIGKNTPELVVSNEIKLVADIEVIKN